MTQSADSTREATAFILPLIVFLVIASFYPDFSSFNGSGTDEASPNSLTGYASVYVGMVAAQVVIAAGLLFYFRAIYLRHFPFKISWRSIVVGIVGIVLWVWLCELHIEKNLFAAIGWKSLAEVRPAFNPFESLPQVGFRNLFLILRFTLLAILVPIIEELFLRGWLVRWIENPNWESVKLNSLSWGAILTPSIYGVITHPSEAIAAFLWFGLVSWLMVRTGNLWDCVLAHAVTNLLLGIYVIQFEAWHLW